VAPIAVAIVLLQTLGSYELISNVFKWLALSLLTYIAAAVLAHPDVMEVIKGTFIPHFELTPEDIAVLVAILGTTISPYLFFWQASQEVEELPEKDQPASATSVKYAGFDVMAGMFLSNAVMYFIILATAATLFQAGQHDVSSATDAAKALEPIAGSASKLLLAFGLIGGGLLAIPVLTGSSAFALAEIFGWERGLDKKPHEAKGFYAVIIAASLVGVLVNFAGINPIRALFFTAIINGLLAPPLLILIMLVSDNPAVMKERANGPALRIAGWITAGVMTLAALAFVAVSITG
jgi:Mn2+/Fe2+ NRAMP family transporter